MVGKSDFGRQLRASRSLLGAGVLALLVLCGIILAWWGLLVARKAFPEFYVSSAATVELIRSWGAWGVVGSIGLMILHSFIPFPAEILALANGIVYGSLWGFAITWIGAMLGAYLAFGIARLFGRPFVKMLIPEKHWEGLEAWSHNEGGITLLLSRFVPVIAFNLINYAAGLTHISWWTFTWATGIGILPLTVLLPVMGDRTADLPAGVWIFLTAGAVVAWVALRRVRRARSDS